MYRETLNTWEERAVVGSPIPPDLRHPRVSEVFTAGDQFLMFTGRGKRDDGSLFNHVEVRAPSGEIIDAIELDYEGYLNTTANDCAIVHRDDIARIYSPDATLVAVFSFKDLPEIQAMIGARKQYYRELGLPFGFSREDAITKNVTASLTHRLLAVTVIDSVFVYDFDGAVLAALSFPETHIEDWAYFVRFSLDGKSLYAGSHSGLVVRMDLQGTVLDTWRIGGRSPFRAVEVDGVLSGITRNFEPFRLFPGGDSYLGPSAHFPSGDLIGPYMVSSDAMVGRKEIAVFDLRSLTGYKVTLPQPRTAIYLVDDELVFETATKKFVLAR